MYNLLIPCNLSHIIVPTYCNVGASLLKTINVCICVATQRKEPYVEEIKIEVCIAYSRGHSALSFWYKNHVSSTIFDRVIANSVIQNIHYEKLNLLSTFL